MKDLSGALITLDLSSPASPVVTDTQAVSGLTENIYARTTPKRAVLVIAKSGGGNGVGQTLVSVYDVQTDCTHPRLLGDIAFPQNVHNLEISPDATKVFGSIPVQEADITNLNDPSTWAVRELQCQIGAQTEPNLYPPASPTTPCAVPGGPTEMAHEFEFSPTGDVLYLGDQTAYPKEQCLHIVDISGSSPKVIGTMCNGDGSSAGHAIRRMTIGGRSYLLNSNETAVVDAFSHLATSTAERKGVPAGAQMANPGGVGANGCVPEQVTPYAGAAQAGITDIADPAHPRMVSRLKLAINDRSNCASQIESGVNAAIHYEGVDNPDNTTFVMLPMKNAGLRIWDVRDPQQAAEVAYFNPAQYKVSDGTTVLDRARMHTYYDAATGHIWLTTETGGFWVLEVEPQVRTALALPTMTALFASGEPAKPGLLAGAPVATAVANSARNPYFCSVSALVRRSPVASAAATAPPFPSSTSGPRP